MLHIQLALIGQAGSEKMFENNGQIRVYNPAVGSDNRIVSKCLYKYKHFVM